MPERLHDPLPVAAMAFTATADVRANANAIAVALARAAADGARVLLTPECALTGYPSAARDDTVDLDWRLVAAREAELQDIARGLGLLLVLGTISNGTLGSGGRCTNDALCGGAIPAQRYAKQCLTPTDVAHFAPGGQGCVVSFAGWRLGIAICYDLRFPDVWMSLAEAGADAHLAIAHMAGPDPDPGTKGAVIPALCAARAAETATPLVFCNTAAADRYLDSGAWDARGLRVATRADGLMTTTLTHRDALDRWYTGLRATALARWRTGKAGSPPHAARNSSP